MHMRVPLFRIWYSTTYTILFLVLLIFLAVTPAETVYQCIRSDEIQKIFVIGGVYLLTAIITLLVYTTRLYTNRSVLAAIPKPYLPIEDGEVGTLVRRMIVKALKRSAIVAWDSRPRHIEDDDAESEANRPPTAERHQRGFRRRGHTNKAIVIPISSQAPPWGRVSHPGWASPSSPDLSNLQYWKVVTELPNLIEAKAVSLAPLDPSVESSLYVSGNVQLPDAHIVALLQRPRSMGLRDYLSRLSSYGLINPPSLAPSFLIRYEFARFSGQSLSEADFRELMAIFVEILNGMIELDPAFIEEARAESGSDTYSITSSEASSSSSASNLPYRTPRMHSQRQYFEFSEPRSGTGNGNSSPQTLQTAPSVIRNASSGQFSMPRTPSERSLRSASGSVIVHSVQRSPSTILPNSSTSSLRSAQSVIRQRPDPGQGQYTYELHLDDI